ncbi:hypothetical protein MRX96_005962 [Rhipicephalus microplus]
MARRPGIHVCSDDAYRHHSAGAAYIAFGIATSIVAAGRFRVLDALGAYCTEALARPHCLDSRIVHIRELIAQISSA